ncbi:Fe-S oxidoreductase [Rhodospirillum rubrum]|uniref:(Fe-S)-binding protein n=1 Tax=Rhodospirillum rubrum TaxID=1085 RepID=UPI001904EE8F|nr:(Fe-S)-binding protein [Rhodospirillum rubrum]MBK1663212.1 Fe-S oxidoreductase [Rhodospirillum rubrum]MBK1676959.1 Fe-S oxidoreductase [Rhodospirillum rubrum]
MTDDSPLGGPRVGFFITCMADLFRPTVGFAAIRLLTRAGCRVEVPADQTCCGQPAFNSGARDLAITQAKRVIETFEGFDYLVGPSGSCLGMIRVHYPALLAEDAAWAGRARALAARSFEVMSFLTDVLDWDEIDARFDGVVTYHDTCSGVREVGIKAQPRRLLAKVRGLELRELAAPEECCGFGGTFCVKYPEISERMVDEKLRDAEATGATTLLGGDISCLLNIAGRARQTGSPLTVRHVLEVLAGMAEGPGLGDGAETPPSPRVSHPA